MSDDSAFFERLGTEVEVIKRQPERRVSESQMVGPPLIEGAGV